MAANTQKDIQGENAQNNLAYSWDLHKDHLDWVGPVHRFMIETKTTNGSSFLEQLSIEDFWKYLETLETAIYNKHTVYLEHHLKNAAGDILKVTHEASFESDLEGRPLSLHGTLSLQSREAEFDIASVNNEINPITFLPNIHLLVENLETHITESSKNMQKGALITLSFDRLILLNALFGTEQVRQLFFSMAKAIRQQIRFDDYFAHIHACVFALILRDCDAPSITTFCNRIEEILKEVSNTLTGNDLTITARIGGIEIDPTMNAGMMINRALTQLNALPTQEMPPKDSPTPSLSGVMDRRKTDH